MKFRIRNDIRILILLSFIFVTLAVTSASRKSATADEVAHHIPAGYVFLKTADFAYSTDAPPLARYLAAFPLLFLDVELPGNRSFWARDDRAEFSREFMYSLNRNQAGKMVFLARLPIILLGVLGGVFMFLWVRKRYDPLTAIIAGLFYFLSPNILAHARLATTDIAATVFIMCSVFSFWDLLVDRQWGGALSAGVFLGLAMMSKYSALLLLPVYFILACGEGIRDRGFRKEDSPGGVFVKFLLCLLIAFLVLWAGYAFEFKPFFKDVLRVEEKEILFMDAMYRMPFSFLGEDFTSRKELISRCVEWFHTVPVPLSSYTLGVIGVLRHGAEGARTFFMGSWSSKGHPLYYLVAFLIKTPVPVILSFLPGIFALIIKKEKRGVNLYVFSFILVFFVTASRSNLQLGLRYVLPVYPFIFIISAFAVKTFFRKGRPYKIAAAVLALWFCAIQFYIWPDYLSYFNELIGGPSNGYKYLRDSNIDWGQDLPALKDFMVRNGITTVKLDYFGESDPSYYGVAFRRVRNYETRNPRGSVYAISAHHIDKYQWARQREPDAMAGRSIFIYDLRQGKNKVK